MVMDEFVYLHFWGNRYSIAKRRNKDMVEDMVENMVENMVKVKIPSMALDHRWYIGELQKEMPEGFTFDWLKRLGWPMDWQGYTWVSVTSIIECPICEFYDKSELHQCSSLAKIIECLRAEIKRKKAQYQHLVREYNTLGNNFDALFIESARIVNENNVEGSELRDYIEELEGRLERAMVNKPLPKLYYLEEIDGLLYHRIPVGIGDDGLPIDFELQLVPPEYFDIEDNLKTAEWIYNRNGERGYSQTQ
jgi:uncharacterized membrane protein